MEVWCGMIIGFDNDDETIFDAQIQFIQEARIAISMTGMLCGHPQDPALRPPGRGGPARPGRPARVRHQRHPAEDRPRGAPRRLRQGDDRALRARALLRAARRPLPRRTASIIGRGRSRYWKRHPWKRLKAEAIWLVQAIGLFLRLMKGVPEAHLRREYRKRLWRFLKVRQNPATLLLLRHPHGPALPRLHHGQADVLGPHAGLQLVLTRHRSSPSDQAFSQVSSHRHASSCISALNSCGAS